MANHMMIDLETLDTRPSAVVFQVGVLCFRDPLFGDLKGEMILEKKIFHLDLLDQIMAGRTIDPDTVQWWQTQKPQAWRRFASQISNADLVFKDINRMYGEYGVGFLWANSPSFDSVIMRSLRQSLQIEHEFPSFREDYDLRTLKRLFEIKGRKIPYDQKETTHNALQDCEDQFQTAIHYLCEFRDMVKTYEKMERDELIPAPVPVTSLTKDT
jgi:hypothetical protein